MPAYNAEGTIAEAIQSALDQTYRDLEIVVVEDGSTDRTWEQILAFDDPRLRVVRNLENTGQSAAASKAIRIATAPYIKFLHADDRLEHDCVARMLELFKREAGIGLVFCRREIVLADADDPIAQRFRVLNGDPHQRLFPLQEVNSGTELLARSLAGGLTLNWVGEPSSVMMSRKCLRKTGLLNLRARQAVDFDLWMRACAVADVGFVPAMLATYRFGDQQSVTMRTVLSGRDWLDRLWTLEGLATLPGVEQSFPRLRSLRRVGRLELTRTLLSAARHRRLRAEQLADTGRYLSYVAQRALGRPPLLIPSL